MTTTSISAIRGRSLSPILERCFSPAKPTLTSARRISRSTRQWASFCGAFLLLQLPTGVLEGQRREPVAPSAWVEIVATATRTALDSARWWAGNDATVVAIDDRAIIRFLRSGTQDQRAAEVFERDRRSALRSAIRQTEPISLDVHTALAADDTATLRNRRALKSGLVVLIPEPVTVDSASATLWVSIILLSTTGEPIYSGWPTLTSRVVISRDSAGRWRAGRVEVQYRS